MLRYYGVNWIHQNMWSVFSEDLLKYLPGRILEFKAQNVGHKLHYFKVLGLKVTISALELS